MTDAGGENEQRREAIEDEAVAWLVRLGGGDQEPAALKAWLRESAEHRRAYAWAKRHFDSSIILKTSSRHGRRRAFRPRNLLARAAIAAAIITIVAIGVSFMSVPPMQGDRQLSDNAPVLKTLPGQIDTFDLADGSKVTMDASSRLTVSIKGNERRLRFQQGRARIAVRSDGRPFIVEAGQGELLTRAARFDIGRKSDGRIEIAVLSGQIELRRLLRPAVIRSYSHHAQAGQTIVYSAGNFRPVAGLRDGVDRRDWPQGWTEYEAIPLRILIADANRYARPPIVLDDPALGDLLVSGRFRLTQADRFSARIADLFDLALSRSSSGIHLQRR
ncbi:FecR domain-containing protein [Sphingobium sp. BS19]|uniref:FecR family protein n=1 Tax=Sphingobium sp. BS19 TaxID=3018973 RepID=UPI0022EF5D9B|nr:FecR domain-containing protein [Sphingobium sp. BS19]GLI98036.1 transcriptional regulator [Sphingobium sp. BS19]